MPLQFSSKAFLAPMAGITDPAFRAMCAKYGAGLTVTELISAQGLLQNNQKTKDLMARAQEENNFAIQLFGSDPLLMAKAAALVEPYCDMIDVNMGCPVDKVCKLGAGSALLATPQLGGEIIRRMVDTVDIPISAKMRIGLLDSTKNLGLTLARTCEDNGASLLTIHGRTKAQKYGGSANWDFIKEIKEQASIPVVGNGDITSPELAKLRLKTTDFVSIGRASSGNPLLFKQIQEYLQTGSYEVLSPDLRLRAFEEYLSFAKEFGTLFAIQRLQAQHFTKGCDGAPQARLRLNSAKTSEELFLVVSELLKPKD